MINNKITTDKKIHDLSCDTSRLAFTWAVTFADVEGRIPGDPAIVKSMVFPRRSDITEEQMQLYIQEWAAQDLIIWYQADDDLWIQFTKFDDNQVGLRKNREAPSTIPAPELRNNSGDTPEQIPVNLTKQKRKEHNIGEAYQFYENNFGMLTPYIGEELGDLADEYTFDWLMDAMRISIESNARNLKYVRAVLKNRKDGNYQKKQSSSKEVWSEEHY